MKTILVLSLVILFCVPAFAQEDISINRYTLYTGFDYFNSPGLSLAQRGFDVDFGVTVRPWLGLGADFSAAGSSILSGSGTINGKGTIYAPTLTAAAPFGAPPPGAVNVPFKSTTYTFAIGGQFYWRRFRRVTLLGRPGLGGIHAAADISLQPQLGGLLGFLGAPVPRAHQSDTTWFFGLGGGADFYVSRRLSLRVTADWINTHLYSDLLTNRQNFVRLTVGPTLRWGRYE